MSAIDLTPRGLLNGDNNYILQDVGLFGLLKYIWAGLLLPQTTGDYSDRLRLPEEMYFNMKSVLAPLIETYNTARGHCETFKDTTYPSITGTADDIFNYARTVAGNGPEPFFAYSYLVELLRQLADTESTDTQATLKKTIGNILNFHLTFIDSIITKSQTAVNNLRAFEQATMTDREAIMLCHKDVVRVLNMDEDALATLQSHLADYRHDLQVDIDEFEKAFVRQGFARQLAEVLVVGVLPHGMLFGLAGRLANAITMFRGLIYNAEGQLPEERAVVAALAATESDVTSLLGTMSPTITMVEGMMGCWQSIAEDLNSIAEAVKADSAAVNAVVERIIEAKIAEKWNTLAEAVDRFRQASNVADVQIQTLDEMENSIKGIVI
ncbi:hypothetical protein EV715DRAFT_267162 [Schizophyllum commune]